MLAGGVKDPTTMRAWYVSFFLFLLMPTDAPPLQHSTGRGDLGNVTLALVAGPNEDFEGKHHLHADVEVLGRGDAGNILHSCEVSRDGSRELSMEEAHAVSQERLCQLWHNLKHHDECPHAIQEVPGEK